VQGFRLGGVLLSITLASTLGIGKLAPLVNAPTFSSMLTSLAAVHAFILSLYVHVSDRCKEHQLDKIK
jgi:hypothetical protein